MIIKFSVYFIPLNPPRQDELNVNNDDDDEDDSDNDDDGVVCHDIFCSIDYQTVLDAINEEAINLNAKWRIGGIGDYNYNCIAKCLKHDQDIETIYSIHNLCSKYGNIVFNILIKNNYSVEKALDIFKNKYEGVYNYKSLIQYGIIRWLEVKGFYGLIKLWIMGKTSKNIDYCDTAKSFIAYLEQTNEIYIIKTNCQTNTINNIVYYYGNRSTRYHIFKV